METTRKLLEKQRKWQEEQENKHSFKPEILERSRALVSRSANPELAEADFLQRQIIKEIEADKKKYADPRRTLIEHAERASVEIAVVDEHRYSDNNNCIWSFGCAASERSGCAQGYASCTIQ